MLKKQLIRQYFLPALFLLAGLSSLLLLPGARGYDKKLTIIVTGDLSGIFHPFGEDPDNAFLRKRLDEIISGLKKSYADALLVDTGNYLSIPDFSENISQTPAFQHFTKHGYDILNLGSNEVLFDKSLIASPFTSDDAKPHLVSTMLNYESKKNIALPLVDIGGDYQKPVRFLGVCRLSHEYSAPHLKDAFQFTYLKDLVEWPPLPGLCILLSDLSHEKNLETAGKITGIDLILESGYKEESTVYREKDTFICHRSQPDSVGLFQLKRNKHGKIDKVLFKSFPLNEKKGFLGLSRKKVYRSVTPPLPGIGNMAKKEKYLDKISVKYDAFEIHRFPNGVFSTRILNSQIFIYELSLKHELVGRSFLVEHSLGPTRPFYLFFITFEPDNRLKRIDFIAPPCFLLWQMGVQGFTERYYGQRWSEMSFDPQGCLGAQEEFNALHEDIALASQIADSLFFPEKK